VDEDQCDYEFHGLSISKLNCLETKPTVSRLHAISEGVQAFADIFGMCEIDVGRRGEAERPMPIGRLRFHRRKELRSARRIPTDAPIVDQAACWYATLRATGARAMRRLLRLKLLTDGNKMLRPLLTFLLSCCAVTAMADADVATVMSDYRVTAFPFANGEVLPDLRLHYRTLGAPTHDETGLITNAVLLLHGADQSGDDFLSHGFADVMFKPGAPLDVKRYFIIVPDDIGSGKSSKPSDAMHARFPHFSTVDAVDAQYRLVLDRSSRRQSFAAHPRQHHGLQRSVVVGPAASVFRRRADCNRLSRVAARMDCQWGQRQHENK
jgi:hypothetical protein